MDKRDKIDKLDEIGKIEDIDKRVSLVRPNGLSVSNKIYSI